jgi:NADH-quinone oxidoreductase subunit G
MSSDVVKSAPVADTVTLTIDGMTVTAPKGALLIRVAEQNGIEIPRFCDHPLLEPAGACRQCLVEVEGQRKPVASCTQPVADGMVVRTQLTSPVARKAQEGIMEMLLINHPLDCPMCDKGGECPLQNQAMSTGRPDTRGSTSSSASTRSPSTSPLRCCWTASGACCASAAHGSPTRSPATASST